MTPGRRHRSQHAGGSGPQARRRGIERDPSQGGDAGNLPASADRFELGQCAAVILGPAGAALEPVEQRIGARIGAGRHQQPHDLRRGAGGRELPAGFVEQRDLLALQQGAHAAHEDAILRDQGNGHLAAPDMIEHLGGGALGFVLEIVAERECGRVLRRGSGEGLVAGWIGVDHEARRGGGGHQPPGQRVDAAGLHGDPGGRRGRGKERVGRRCGRQRRPLQRDPRQQALGRTRAGERRQRVAGRGPVRGPLARRERERSLRQRMRGRRDGDRCLLEAACIAPRPGHAPRLRAQQRGGAQRIDSCIETDLPAARCRRRAKARRQRPGGLDPRLPAARAGKGAPRQRQQLREWQQHDRIAQQDALVARPRQRGARDTIPAIPAGSIVFERSPFYRCHRNEDGRERPHGPPKAGRCVRIIVPCHPTSYGGE